MGRVVIEHDDGRRLTIDADGLNDPTQNPYNHDGLALDYDDTTGRSIRTVRPGRPLDDHRSLAAEGFRVVGRILDHDLRDPATGAVLAHAGAEVGLEGDS